MYIVAFSNKDRCTPIYCIYTPAKPGTISPAVSVLDPRKGVCADPVDGGAILGKGELDPHSKDRERQLAPDRGRGKT